jgi:hypothetical protein
MMNNGAPRSTKMGTIASPWGYDGGASRAIQSANPRRVAISRYASRMIALPDLPGWSGYPRLPPRGSIASCK